MNIRSLMTLGLFFCIPLSPQLALAQVDPGAPGPLQVTRAEYDYGDDALRFGSPPNEFPTEVRAVVYYPTNLATGPFPVVVFLHGWHPTCYLGTGAYLEWPCAAGHEPIPSYRGYEYEQQILASHGYIVVSISANGVNAKDTRFQDVGMLWRAVLLQRHLDQWNTFNTKGAAPFGTTFVGAVDLTRVGTMGHSRGGEGVARHYVYNREQGSPYGLLAVLPLAPVNFSREVMDGVNLNVLLPYCDGDVSDLQGVHFYDDSRYIAGDTTNKHITMVFGSNHAFYNTIWTPGGWPASTWDDWIVFQDGTGVDPFCGTGPGNHRLDPARTRGTFIAYATAFYRTYVGGETDFLPLLKGDTAPPPSATTDEILMSYHAHDAPGSRLDVNRTLDVTALTTDALGGPVVATGLTTYYLCGSPAPDPQHCLPTPPQPTSRQPHTTPSARSPLRGTSQLKIGWEAMTATYRNDLPVGTDITPYGVFQFRASVNWFDTRNPAGVPQDLSVRITDGSGNTASARASDASAALYYPPGEQGPIPGAPPGLQPHLSPVPKVLMNTVRIPLSSFAGIDLTDIRSVELDFDQTASGALLLTDLAFSD